MAGIKKFGFDKIQPSGFITPEQDTIIERRLRYLGEEMCNHARTVTPNRESGGFDDHTGNLRGSIGFSIYHNGELVTSGGFDSRGSEEGEQNAKRALSGYSDIPPVGWCLLIVAGMSYATYVEAKGYNVLSLTEGELQKEIEELKKDLKI